jgi:hypothetical protein
VNVALALDYPNVIGWNNKLVVHLATQIFNSEEVPGVLKDQVACYLEVRGSRASHGNSDTINLPDVFWGPIWILSGDTDPIPEMPKKLTRLLWDYVWNHPSLGDDARKYAAQYAVRRGFLTAQQFQERYGKTP